MKNKKIKSSSLLIALVLGLIIMVIVIGIAAAIAVRSKLSAQARDGKIAYRAALSGIDDGLMRYKYAKAAGFETQLFKATLGNFLISVDPRLPQASYDLSFKINPPNVGSLTAANLPDDNSPRAQMDNVIDIDLYYLQHISLSGLGSAEIYFTNPKYPENNKLDGYFTAMNYRLINDVKVGTMENEQLVKEDTNLEVSNHTMVVYLNGACQISNSRCHLKIKPQTASLSQTSDILNSSASRRISGATGQAAISGKYVNYAIRVRDINGNYIDIPSTDTPGTIVITSIGKAGEAERKLEARIDASSGNYLGLFDYGVYCGDKCEGLGSLK